MGSRANGLWSPSPSRTRTNAYPAKIARDNMSGRDSHAAGTPPSESPALRRDGTAARPQVRGTMPPVPGLEVDWSIVVDRCLRGDSGAWAELVRSHHRRVYGMCYRFTGSAHDAEDLTQEVFLKLYGNLRSFNSDKGSFTTWITTLTRNLLVDHFRRSRMERATDSLDAGWDNAEEAHGGADLLQTADRSPHDQTVARELGRMVQAALAKVSPELREAVILRDLEDMDYKEIALVLRVPEGTVKSRISRGRAELARLLGRNKRQVM